VIAACITFQFDSNNKIGFNIKHAVNAGGNCSNQWSAVYILYAYNPPNNNGNKPNNDDNKPNKKQARQTKLL
jgi:hypothetical protein